MKPILIILNGDRAGERLLLEAGKRYILGRDQTADICLPEKKISRRHACITWNHGFDVTVEDLGSLNGSTVNGEIISGQHPVADGDRIQIGSFLLQIQIPEPSKESHSDVQTDRKPKKSAKDDISILPVGAPFESDSEDEQLTGGRLISGRLEEIGLADLLQMLAQTKKSGVLVLSDKRITKPLRPHQDDSATFLYMSEGDLEYAVTGDTDGEDAFFECLKMQSGYFALFPIQPGEEYKKSITTPLEALLLEGFRRLDEERASQEKVSDTDSFDVQPDEPLGTLSTEELTVFQLLWKHKKLSAVLKMVPMSHDETVDIVKKLLRGGFLKKASKKS